MIASSASSHSAASLASSSMAMFLHVFVASLSLLTSAHQVTLNAPIHYPFTTAFDKLVAVSLDRWHCPGLAIAIIDGDDTFSKVRYSMKTFNFHE